MVMCYCRRHEMDKNLFDSLVSSVEEMVAIENGELTSLPENVHIHIIPTIDGSPLSSDLREHKELLP